ncbi:MAG: hypothetical protein IPH68_16825 [Chitinophagaceae bacterium]|nr:hypothetical protein [Chitinophagaceae bacterium]
MTIKTKMKKKAISKYVYDVALDVFIGFNCYFFALQPLASILMRRPSCLPVLALPRMTRKAISNLLDDRDFTDENF